MKRSFAPSSSAPSSFAPKSTTVFLIALALVALAAVPLVFPSTMRAQEQPASKAVPDKAGWLAVAPGRVEPWSGEIRLSAALPGRVAAVLVKPNDKVFAGEPLIRLDDDEMQIKLEASETQVALRKRARGDQGGGARGGERRRIEDAVGDAERAVVAAQEALDKAAAARRTGSGTEVDLDALRAELTRARERHSQQKAEQSKLDNDATMSLPTTADGELRKARHELTIALQAMEKLIIRAPISGAILQVNARVGELAVPSAVQPLILLGDIKVLRVRAEVEERDLGNIKVGHDVVVRAPAFRGREISGKVSFVAPLVEQGKISARGQRSLTDVNAAEVLVDLSEAGPLLVGMKVDVYFR